MDKKDVARALEEIAGFLELKGENPFKTRAYSNAARTLEGLTVPLSQLVAEGRLGEVPGIGEAIRAACSFRSASARKLATSAARWRRSATTAARRLTSFMVSKR